MVSPTGISMDVAKTEAISNWPMPTNVKQIQSFIGFANFYRRFIVNFSETVTPLTRLTRKEAPWIWGPEQLATFENLKLAFTQAPVLSHFNPDNPIVVETDASNYAIAAIISQISPNDGDLHPIAFFSKGMKPAELNYEIYDKELLAIFEAFRQWRNYLEGSTHVVLVLSDHKNLEYFATTKQLTRRQVRWLEYLSGFNYLIRYLYALANPHNFQLMFKPGQLLWAIILDLAALLISIKQGLATDPVTQNHFGQLHTTSDNCVPRWMWTPRWQTYGRFRRMESSCFIKVLCTSLTTRISALMSCVHTTITAWLDTRASQKWLIISNSSSSGPDWSDSSPTTSTHAPPADEAR